MSLPEAPAQELRMLTGCKPTRASSAIDIPEEAAQRVPARSRSRCVPFFCAAAARGERSHAVLHPSERATP